MSEIKLLCIFLLFNISVFAQSNKDIRNYGIKTVTETTIEYEDGIEYVKYKSKFLAYDTEGNLIEEAEWDEEGNLEYRETSRYEKGERVERVEDYPNKMEEKSYYKKTVEEFDKGLKIKETVYTKDSLVKKYELFKYDNLGNRTEKNEFNREDVLLETTTYKYDSKGLLIEETRVKNGVLDKKEFYEYTF